MGDPKKRKKKYDTPRNPWQIERLEEERKLMKKYGLRNKRELWRMETLLRGFRRQARKLLALETPQAKKEEIQLLEKLRRLKMLKRNSTLDDVLALKIEDILDRRLQTLVFKKGLANTPKQARQFIVHGHISIKGRKVTAPSYLVGREEENSIGYIESSPLKNLEAQTSSEKVKEEA
jgi:small subunit ribosomal protein S4